MIAVSCVHGVLGLMTMICECRYAHGIKSLYIQLKLSSPDIDIEMLSKAFHVSVIWWVTYMRLVSTLSQSYMIHELLHVMHIHAEFST